MVARQSNPKTVFDLHQIKRMKAISCILVLVISGCVALAATKPPLKRKPLNQNPNHLTEVAAPNHTNTKSSEFAISITGPKNSVKIGDAEAVTKSPANPAIETKAKNTINITGTGNTVAVNPGAESKIKVKQTGNNNHISISQAK